MSVCPYEKPCGKKPCDDGGKCPKDTEPYKYVPYVPYIPDPWPTNPYYPPYWPTVTWCSDNTSATPSFTVTLNRVIRKDKDILDELSKH